MNDNKKIDTKTPLECAQRLLALFRSTGGLTQRASVGYLTTYFRGSGFAQDEYRRAVDYALDKKWIAFPADNSVMLTPVGMSALTTQGRQPNSSPLSHPGARQGSR